MLVYEEAIIPRLAYVVMLLSLRLDNIDGSKFNNETRPYFLFRIVGDENSSVASDFIKSDLVRARYVIMFFKRNYTQKKKKIFNFLPTPATVTSCKVERASRDGC